VEFEWDPNKAASNLRKHRISFEEAATAFSDILSFTYEDEAHSQVERRYATLGMSGRGRVLVVSHTMRGKQVRIIARAKLRRVKEDGMKKKPNKTADDDELLPEYDFSKMKLVGRGIYAERYRSGTNIVLLDRDVREAFPDDESVNEALRVIAKAARLQALRAKRPQTGKTTTRTRRVA